MPLNLRPIVDRAKKRTPWSLGNEVLYDLCHEHPLHTKTEVVIAKMLLIGRVYAAAIERRKPDLSKPSDDFYVQRVAPSIIGSSLDAWIERAKRQTPGTPEALVVMTEVHSRTTNLFRTISGLEKRSLASKYLHFHVPDFFFIYDSRATKGMRKCSDIVGRASTQDGVGDPSTQKFVEKCTRLSQHLKSDKLTPRELDNVLLELSA